MPSIRKAIGGIVLVTLIIVGVQAVTRFCYEDWSSPTIWSKKEREELKGTLDTLYCGSSLAYCAYNTEILDEAMGTNSFNLGTASQPYLGTYYLIKETVDENPVQRIYLTVAMPLFQNEDVQAHHYVSPFENMCSWKWKLAYLSEVNDQDVWMASMLYSTQVKDYLDYESVKDNLQNKLEIKTAPKSYAGRGYRTFTATYKGRDRENNLKMNTWVDESKVLDEGRYYFEKIIEFCQEEEIELILVAPPFTQDFINGAGDMDGFHQYIAGIAEKWGVAYYDFSLYKERQTVFTNELFRDVNHLNKNGATAFCNLLVEVMRSNHPQEYFYNSYTEFQNI